MRAAARHQAVVFEGHRWSILPEDTPEAAQMELSMWRNADQNENQQTHEMEILRSFVGASRDLALVTSTVGIGDLVATAKKAVASEG